MRKSTAKVRNSYLIIVFTILSSTVLAQIRPLKIGDKVPETYLKKIRQLDTTSSSSLSAYHGKLIILDFWATWCSPCIAAMPKLDSLQKKFEGKLQVLAVSNQQDSLVSQFFKKLYKAKNIKPISVVEDTLLNSFFPHNEIPYCVWINSEGVVKAITEDNQVNDRSISEALFGNFTDLKINNIDKYFVLAENKPLFSLTNSVLMTNNEIKANDVDDQLVTYQSIFTKYVPGLSSRVSWDSLGYKATNVELAFLYKSIYNISTYDNYTNVFYQKGRVTLEIADPKMYDRITNPTAKPGLDYNQWLKKNGVCYDLLWGNTTSWKDRFEMLKEDLERYISKPMGLKSRIEKRTVRSYVLTKIGNTGLLKTTGGKPEKKADAFSFEIKNLDLDYLIGEFQGHVYQRSPIPFFNETGITAPVDLAINCSLSKMDLVNQELYKYGLKFILKDRNADVLVITDKKNL